MSGTGETITPSPASDVPLLGRAHRLWDGGLCLAGELACDHRTSGGKEFPYGKDNPYKCQDGSDELFDDLTASLGA